MFQHGQSPAFSLLNDRLGFIAYGVENGEDAGYEYEGSNVGFGDASDGAVFEDGWDEGDEAGEEDAYGGAAGEQDDFAFPALGEGFLLIFGSACLRLAVVVVMVGVAVSHVHGESRCLSARLC